MKTLFFKLTTLAAMGMGVFVPRGLADCATTWEVPQNHFDGVDNFGHVEYWDKIAEIDIGEDKPFPIVIGFNSDRDSTSPYLGYGWVMPLLESYMVQTGENTFEIMKPTGYTSGFGRDPKRATAIGGVKGWKGEVGSDTIKVWAPCGWSLTYTRGKLTEVATPKGKRISVNRGLDGQVEDVVMDGRILVKVLKSFEDRVEGIEVQGERIAIEFGEKPRVRSVQGSNVVAGMDRSVGKITLPDGQLKTYDYSVDGKLEPTLRIAGTQMAERKMTWDAARRLITSDREWKYDIKPAETAGQNAAIGRTDSKGAKEFWHYDGSQGEEILETADRKKRFKKWFTNGSLVNKLRRIEEYENGQLRKERTYAYNEQGRLTRETITSKRIASDGSSDLGKTKITIVNYDELGHLISRTTDGIEHYRKIYDSQGRLKSTLNEGAVESIIYSTDTEWNQILSSIRMEDRMREPIKNATKVIVKPTKYGSFYSFCNDLNKTFMVITPSGRTKIY